MKYVSSKKRTTRKRTKKMPVSKISTEILKRQVRVLQSQMDGEKKRITTFSQALIGQVEGNNDGIEVINVTPIPQQGIQTNMRTGASIRLHSTNYQFNIGQATDATVARINYKLTWLLVKGAPYTTSTLSSQFINNVYNPNPFISVTCRDYNCQYNPDYFNTYKVLKVVKGFVPTDPVTNVALSRSFSVGFKYNRGKGHEVRFNQNTNGQDNVFNGQIILVIQCDRGNSDPVVTSTAGGIYSTLPGSGLFLQYNKIDYYYDN